MKQRAIGAAVLALLALELGSNAHAQTTIYSNPNQAQPLVSPYIGLLRGGASPGLNFANYVQPQVQFYNTVNHNQYGNGNLGANGLPSTNTAAEVLTGHPVQFGNYLHYYTYSGINTGYQIPGTRSTGVTTMGQQQKPQGFGYQPQGGLGQNIANMGQSSGGTGTTLGTGR